MMRQETDIEETPSEFNHDLESACDDHSSETSFGHSLDDQSAIPGVDEVATYSDPIRNADSSESRAFQGIEGDIRSVAYSPNGKYIATGSVDIHIWDAATGRQVQTVWKGLARSIVAFSPNGSHLIGVSGFEKSMQVWDMKTHRTVLGPLQPKQRGYSVLVVQYSPDGLVLAGGADDATVRIWDASSARRIAKIAHPASVPALSFSPSGKHIATGCEDGLVRIWNIEHQKIHLALEPLSGHVIPVHVVAYSPDGRFLASGGQDWTIRIWDSKTGTLALRPLVGHCGDVQGLCYSPDGQTLVSISRDATVRKWDMATGDCVLGPLYSDVGLRAVSYSPDGRNIAVGGDNGQMTLLDAMMGRTVLSQGRKSISPTQRMKSMFTSPVSAMAWFPDGKGFASAGGSKVIQMWSAKTGESFPDAFIGHTANVSSVDISYDGLMLVSGSFDKTIGLWTVQSRKLVMDRLRGHTDRVRAVKFTPDSSRVMSGGDDRTIRVWDTRSGSLIRVIKGHGRGIYSLDISCDGSKLASGSDDKTARIWSLDTYAPLIEPFSHDGPLASVCFSPDGSSLLTGSWSKQVKKGLALWDISSGQQILALDHYGVECVQYSPDGRFLLSTSSYTKSVSIWDAKTAKMLRSHQHDGHVYSAVFSTDGRRIISGTDNGHIRIWSVESGELLLGRKLKDDDSDSQSGRSSSHDSSNVREARALDEQLEDNILDLPAILARQRSRGTDSHVVTSHKVPPKTKRQINSGGKRFWTRLLDFRGTVSPQKTEECELQVMNKRGNSRRKFSLISPAKMKELLAGAPERPRRKGTQGRTGEQNNVQQEASGNDAQAERQQHDDNSSSNDSEAHEDDDLSTHSSVAHCSCLGWKFAVTPPKRN